MMDETINIAMLGISGSGKTTFISGLNQSLIEDCLKGGNRVIVSLTGSQDDPNFRSSSGRSCNLLAPASIMEQYRIERLMSVEKNDGTYTRAAAGTMVMRQMVLNFNVGRESVPIKISDYRGGILSASGEEADDDEVNALASEISEANIIYVLVDGIKLAQYRDMPYTRKRETGASRIHAVLTQMAQDPQKGVSVILLVTKTDSTAIPNDLRKNGCKGLCDLAVETIPFIKYQADVMTENYDWQFSVVPVTAVGEGNTITTLGVADDEYVSAITKDANIQQKNMDSALIYGIKHVLAYHRDETIKMIRKMDNVIRIRTERKKISGITGHIKNWFSSGRMDSEDEARLNDAMETKGELEYERDVYSKMIVDLIEGFYPKFSEIRPIGAD